MGISFGVSTNAQAIYGTGDDDADIVGYRINRATPLTFVLTATLGPHDTFIESNVTTSSVETGVGLTKTDLVMDLSGTFTDILHSTLPDHKYLDLSYQEHTVHYLSDIPVGGDYYAITQYVTPDKTTGTIDYTFTVTFNERVEGDGGSYYYQDSTVSEEITIEVINNWTGDKNAVEDLVASSGAASSGGGLPMSTVGNGTSGHMTYPPSVIVAGSGKVMVGGAPAAFDSSVAAPHTNTVPNYDTHVPVAVGGSSKVYVEGKLAVRVADDTNCGGCLIAGSGKVLSV